jgi:hypothetical protein
MARKAIYKHATQVDTSSYPDDGSSPVGTNEWNEAPDQAGMYGNTPTTATVTIASGVLTVTDSVTVAAAEAGTSDTLDKLAITNTSQYDLIYLFADTGDTITLTNTSSPSASGQVKTISGSNEVLSTTVPTILIRKGNFWYGYGGGTTADGSITTAKLADNSVTSAKIVDGAIVNADVNASAAIAQSKIASLTTDLGLKAPLASPTFTGTTTAAAVTVTGALTGALTGNADTVTTNANLTGEVTSSGNATTIADNMVDEANLKVSNAPTNAYVLTARSGNTGGMTWEAASAGGATIIHQYSNTQTTTYTGTASSFGTVGVGTRDVYIKKIDANNEGVFTKIWKNGAAVEVQIA